MSKHHNSLQEALLSRLPSLTAEMSVSLSPMNSWLLWENLSLIITILMSDFSYKVTKHLFKSRENILLIFVFLRELTCSLFHMRRSMFAAGRIKTVSSFVESRMDQSFLNYCNIYQVILPNKNPFPERNSVQFYLAPLSVNSKEKSIQWCS